MKKSNKDYYSYKVKRRHKVKDKKGKFKKDKDGNQLWEVKEHKITTTNKASIPKDAYDIEYLGNFLVKSNDSNYWQRRLKHELDKERNRILTVTDQALKEVYEKETEKVYNHLLRVLARLESDSRNGGEVTFNTLYQSIELNKLLEYLNNSAARLGAKQLKITDQALLDILRESEQIIEDMFPKDLRYMELRSKLRIIDDKTLIRSAWAPDHKDFSQRIWKSKADLINSIRMIVGDTVIQGKSAFDIAGEITKRYGVDFNSAYRLARTESAHVQIMTQAEKFKDYGYQYAIYRATDPCDECGELDGKRFTLDEIQSLIPHHPNCECYFTLDLNRGL